MFYIGQSGNLHSRLNMHLDYATQVLNDDRREGLLYYPRYEYAGKFGKSYAYLRTWQRMKPKALEEELMACFARQYHAFPIANAAGSWNRVYKHLGLPTDTE